MFIAQYRFVDSGITSIFPLEFEKNALQGAVRISDPVDVEFTPRDALEIEEAKLLVLDLKRAELKTRLAKLERKEEVPW